MMPIKLPSKDVWAVYRTAVLGYPLTKQPGWDKMGAPITTEHGRNLTAKELLFWHTASVRCDRTRMAALCRSRRRL